MNLENSQNYYGKVLEGSSDLRTDACCTFEMPSPSVREALRNVHEVLSVFPPPPITRAPGPAGGGGSVTVNKDFLEKKSIRMWSIPQLRAAIELQLLREEREKQRKHKALGFLEVGTPEPASDHIVKSLTVRSDRFRSCFISMTTVILKELPFYEPLIQEKSKICRV